MSGLRRLGDVPRVRVLDEERRIRIHVIRVEAGGDRREEHRHPWAPAVVDLAILTARERRAA